METLDQNNSPVNIEPVASSAQEIQAKSPAEVSARKSTRDEKSRKKDDKSVEQVLRALNSLETTEEKLAAMCKKYTDIVDENRKMQVSIKQTEKRLSLVYREKEQLQTEHSKAVLTRSRLESLCRELQRQNKAVKDESLLKIREEEEKRKEVSGKFQTTLAEITTLMQQNNEKNTKLREDNLEMTKKFKSVCEQYELREQQVEKISRQMQLEAQLADAKLAQAKMEMAAEKEALLREKKQLLTELKDYQNRCQDLQATEINLRSQITLYTDKYDEFQNALSRSNEVFGGFKGEMDKMSKKICKLEKETSSWKQRWEKSHQALLEMAADKQQRDEELKRATRQLEQLQKLCRTLQSERTALISQLKALGNNAGKLIRCLNLGGQDDEVGLREEDATVSAPGLSEELQKTCEKLTETLGQLHSASTNCCKTEDCAAKKLAHTKSLAQKAKPRVKVAKPPAAAAKAPTEAAKLPAEAAKLPAEAAKPPAEAAKPPAEAAKPPAEAAKPPAEAAKPHVESAKPPAEAAKPPAEAAKPHVESAKPHVESAKPPAEAAKPPAEAAKPPTEAAKPHAEAAKPHTESAKPPAEAAKPLVEAAKQHFETAKLPVETIKPSVETFIPLAEAVKPLTEVVKPPAEKSQTKGAKPLAEVAKPPAEKSPAKVIKPPSKAVKPPVEIAEVVKPLAEMTNLMLEATKPLVEITNSSTETTRALIEEDILSNETDALLAEAMEILAKAADPQQPSDLGPRPPCGTSIKQNIADSSESRDVTSVDTSLNLLETSLNDSLVSPLHESLHDVTSVEEKTSRAGEDPTAVPDTLLAPADKHKPLNKINVPQSTIGSRFQEVYEVTGSESDNNEPNPVAVSLPDSEVSEKSLVAEKEQSFIEVPVKPTSPQPSGGKVDSIREEEVPEVTTCGKGSKSEVKPIANGHITAVPVTSVAPNKPVAHDKKVKVSS
uniref:(California timema) hypothetical protein n=1 Tax=Timema californicum TaxID=61474 RepID=A0A7R9JDU5_TIMCA|nr:unnamed protein product [Timema californicum]